MKIFAISVFVAGLFFTAGTGAQPSAEKLRLSTELVRLLDYKELFSNYLSQCQQPADTHFDPKTAYAADPESFGGLTPESPHWVEITAIYKSYQKRVCTYLSAEEFSRFFVMAYAESVSADDMRAAIAFHASPAGRRLHRSSVLINASYLTYAQQALNTLYQQAYKDAGIEVRAVIEKHREESP